MATRKDLREWLIEALEVKKGSASIPEVCKYIWENYENELRRSGNLFFTWQYDIRWAAKQLRDEGITRPHELSPRGIWELVQKKLTCIRAHGRVFHLKCALT